MSAEGTVTIKGDKYCSPVSAHVVPAYGAEVTYHFCGDEQDKPPFPNRSGKILMTYELMFACDKVKSDERLQEAWKSTKKRMDEINRNLDGKIKEFKQKK